MADKIDQLEIGSTKYDIDLPPDATPSIASLTVSGAISEGGTSLVNKYLGKSAKAADSDTVDNYHAEQLLVYAKYKYHDIAAFCNAAVPVYEVSADGSTGWTETTLNKDIFAAKENFSFQVTNTSQLGARFTWKSGIVWSSINYAIIGWTYQATPATVTLKFESSADSGATWTDRGTTTDIKLNSTPALYNFSSPGGDTWFRVSIIQTSETGSKNISTIKLLTSRWGDQGLGSEYEKPYASDGNKTVRPWSNNAQLLGTSSYKWKEIHGVTIYEDGTSLANKYLGKSAKSADSDKLDGNDSTYYQKALPTTATAGKVLKSTATAGTVEWADDANTDTKNTAGTTNKTATKMYLVGATEQSANPQTYSNSNTYIGTDNCLYSNGTKVLTSHQSIKTLKTDNTTAQTASSSEAIVGSGTINLHKIAKTGTYGDLIGTPIPGDSGEIKTKYRVALKEYTGSGNPTWYYKLVKLPADNSGNYASAIINGRIGGWTAGGMSSIYCLIWNRDGVGLSLLDLGGTGTMSTIFDTADLVVYKNSDNTADIYIKCKGYFTFDLDVEVYQSTASITYDGTYITTTPSGTESGKASTSTSRLQLEKGVLKVNGTAVQNKISALGSATKPVYFSSDGVASACSTYAGGTAITLNGTSKAASTASFYAPTSVGTNGQLLASNGSSLVWTNDNRGLLHHDLAKTIDNTTTDSGWSMFNDTYDGFLLKSLRFNANSPAWGVGNYGAGIVFGGVDTKGVVSVSYGAPQIKIAGGNGTGPVWWIKLTGTSAASYNLDKLNNLGTRANYSYNSSTGTLTITTL